VSKDNYDEFDELFNEKYNPENLYQSDSTTTVSTGLPISFHEDGIPIFERSDIIRPAISLDGVGENYLYQNLVLPEHRALRPEIRLNLIVLSSKINNKVSRSWLGKTKTSKSQKIEYGRVIQALDSTGRVIIQKINRNSEIKSVIDFVIFSVSPMQLVIIPPEYEVELVNLGQTPMKFLEIQANEESRDVESLIRSNGMGYILESENNLQPNIEYDELSIPRFVSAHDSFKFLRKRPLYTMITQYPKGFEFMDPPDPLFFHGAV
jgi:hypothetical protein